MSTYKNKTYIAFDGDSDIRYYHLMTAWKKRDGTTFNFYDAHDLNNLLKGSDGRPVASEETIKRRLSERLNNAKAFIILIGDKTKFLYKFVRWEIEKAIEKNIPIIAVNLNGTRWVDKELCPSILRNKLSIHVSFNAKIVEYALNNWIDDHNQYKKDGIDEPYKYNNSVYENLGL